MGRPIKKTWFSVKEGSNAGDLTLSTTAGDKVVAKQTGTGVYVVDEGRVKLADGAPVIAADGTQGIVGDAFLTHDDGVQGPRNVRKINQYRIYYFEDGVPGSKDDAVWRDSDGALVGTLIPALTTEGEEPGGGVLGGETGGDTSGGDTGGDDTDPDCDPAPVQATSEEGSIRSKRKSKAKKK